MSNDRSKPAGPPPGEGGVERPPPPRPTMRSRPDAKPPRPLGGKPPPPPAKPPAETDAAPPERSASRSALPSALVGPTSRPTGGVTPGQTGVRVRLPGPPRVPREGMAAREPAPKARAPLASSDPAPVSSDNTSKDSDLPLDSLPPPSFRVDESGSHRQIGRCELFAEIAHGGMATVHLGRWVGAGGFVKTVAVKALHTQFARDPEFVRMFLDEAQVVARIRHPNVMPTIDLVEERGELFIVMEFVESVTFSELVKRVRRKRERVPVNVVLRVMIGVLHGLHAAHEVKDSKGRAMSLIHRDVSPENILVGTDGYARLIDFGIARALGRHSSTREGQVKGKLGYLAPEQVTGDPLDRRTDVFSAAVVLWQALTGRKLFRARTIAEVTHKILYADVLPPSRHVPQLGKRFDDVVMRGLERDPAKRWETAEQMAEALEALAEIAPHREVGAWVRSTAEERLKRIAKLVKAVENAPLTDTPASALERPLSIHPGPPGLVPDKLELSTDILSGEDVSRTDMTGQLVGRRIVISPVVLIGAGAVLLALLIALVVVLSSSSSETQVPSAVPPEPKVPVAPTAVPSATPTMAPTAAPSVTAVPSAAPSASAKGKWRRDPRLPNDI